MEEDYVMKKFVFGFVLGALIFGGTTVLADNVSLIGKEIQGELTVYFNGEPLIAKAIVVDGVSYLPIRTVGNTLGARIEYRNGAVYVEKENEYEEIKEQVMNDIKREMRKEEILEEIKKLRSANEKFQESLISIENDIKIGQEKGADIQAHLIVKSNLENSIKQNLQIIAELEAELAALEEEEENK